LLQTGETLIGFTSNHIKTVY